MITNNEPCLLCGGNPLTIHCRQYENTTIIIDPSVINLGSKEEEKAELKKRCDIISKYLFKHKVDIMKQPESKPYRFFYKKPCIIENDPLAIDVSKLNGDATGGSK